MSMDTPAWNQGAELPPTKKSGSKTWLILGVVLGICVLICCGGGVALMTYIGTQAAGLASVDPVEVNKHRLRSSRWMFRRRSRRSSNSTWRCSANNLRCWSTTAPGR